MSRVIVTPGHQAPNFTCNYIIGDEVVKDFHFSPCDGNYKILVFYSGDFNPMSEKDICSLNAFSDRYKIYAISTDTIHIHKAWLDHLNKSLGDSLRIPLISDSSRSISALYSSINKNGTSNRSFFIIDKKGTIIYHSSCDDEVNLNYNLILGVIMEYIDFSMQ